MSEQKKSFVEKVMEFLKGGDEKNLRRFHKRFIKDNDRQIKYYYDKNETLNEALLDTEDQIAETVLNVDLSRINSVGDCDSYISTYRKQLNDLINLKDDLIEQIENNDIQIERYELLSKLVK